MPVYEWRCTQCDKHADILRFSAEDHLLAPTDEDAGSACPKFVPVEVEVPAITHMWTRVFGKFGIAKGPGWGPGKGNWAR